MCSAAEVTVDSGRVGDDDPAARGGLDVDVVHAHARAADHLQAVGALDQRRPVSFVAERITIAS